MFMLPLLGERKRDDSGGNQSEKGSTNFAAILNQEGIDSLSSKYGVTDISNISTSCVYTSTFTGSS